MRDPPSVAGADLHTPSATITKNCHHAYRSFPYLSRQKKPLFQLFGSGKAIGSVNFGKLIVKEKTAEGGPADSQTE